MFARFRKWLLLSDETLKLAALDDRLLADMGFDRHRLRQQLKRGLDEPSGSAASSRSDDAYCGALLPRSFRLAHQL